MIYALDLSGVSPAEYSALGLVRKLVVSSKQRMQRARAPDVIFRIDEPRTAPLIFRRDSRAREKCPRES